MKFLAVVCALVVHALLHFVEGHTCAKMVEAHPSACGLEAGSGIFMETIKSLSAGAKRLESRIEDFVPVFADLADAFKDAEESNENCMNREKDRTKIEAFEKYKGQLAGPVCNKTEFPSYNWDDRIEEGMIVRASPSIAGPQAGPTATALKKKDPKTVMRTLAAKNEAMKKKTGNRASFLETRTKQTSQFSRVLKLMGNMFLETGGRRLFRRRAFAQSKKGFFKKDWLKKKIFRKKKGKLRSFFGFFSGRKLRERRGDFKPRRRRWIPQVPKVPTWLRQSEIKQCVPKTFEQFIPLMNPLLASQKDYLLRKVRDKIKNIKLPSKEGVTFQGPLHFERFNYDKILIEQHPLRKQRYTVKIKGIDVKLRRLNLKIRRRLFFMFLETGGRRLFRRRASARSKKWFKKIGKFVKKAVQVVKTVVTNKVKCNGWVDVEYGRADIEVSIVFTNVTKNEKPPVDLIPPKIDLSKLKINFHVDNVCEVAVKFKGKGKIINMIKGKVEKVLNDKIPELEKKVEAKINEFKGFKTLLKMCDGNFSPIRWVENVLDDKCLVGTIQQFINTIADFREFLDRIDKEGDPSGKVKNLKGAVSRDLNTLRVNFKRLRNEMVSSGDPHKLQIGEAARRAWNVVKLFFGATPNQVRFDLCDVSEESDNAKRIPKLLEKLGKGNEAISLILYQFFLLYRVVGKASLEPHEYLFPIADLAKSKSTYSMMREAPTVTTFKRKDGTELNVFSLRDGAWRGAKSALNKVLYYTLVSKDPEGGKDRYNGLMTALHSPYFFRFLDNILQLVRDGTHAFLREEEYQMRVQKKKFEDTTTQRDLRWVKAKINGISETKYPPKEKLQTLKSSFGKALDLLYKIGKQNPSNLYFNFYSPIILPSLVGDFLTGHLTNFVEFVIHCIKVGEGVFTSNDGSTKLTARPVAKEIMSIINSTRATWNEGKARIANCLNSEQDAEKDKEGKCYHTSDPCPPFDRKTGLTASHCMACLKKDIKCRVHRGSNLMIRNDAEPRRPWNIKTRLTILVLKDRALDIFGKAWNIENTYEACSIKESKKNVLETKRECPGLALPEPNLFKLFRRKETGKFNYWWDSELEKYPNKDDIGGWVSGNSLEGFQCTKDCQNCYGESGYYPFPNAQGYDLSAIPVTSTYSAEGTEIPWIREENWDKKNGFYRPRCECEPSYAEDTKQKHVCKGEKYSDNTMVCELVRNGGILNGCHQGRFVVSGIRKTDGDRKCFLVEIDLARAEHDLAPGVDPDVTLDYTRQCVRRDIGGFLDSQPPTAERAVPTVTPLRKTCLPGWEESEMSSEEVTFCRKTADDSFERALKALNKKRKDGFSKEKKDSGKSSRRLLQRRTKAMPRRRLLQKANGGS
eukprot:g2141.t1